MATSDDARQALDESRADLRAYRALHRPTSPGYAEEVQRLETIVAERSAEWNAQ